MPVGLVRGRPPPLIRRLAVTTAIAAAAMSVFVFIGGGPVSLDELLYLWQGVEPSAAPTILNRYVHIYLQKLFVTFAANGLQGVQIYWGFVVAVTMGATYWVAAQLTGWRGVWVSALALVFLIGQGTIFNWVGVTYADYTVMMFVTVAGAVYLAGITAAEGRRHWHAFLLGLLFVLAVKSKETGLVLFALAVGIIVDAWAGGGAAAARRAMWWVAGALVATVSIMTLDALILGDFWFSVRPSNIEALLAFNHGQYARAHHNWISQIAISDLALPFAFYGLALVALTGRKTSVPTKILYGMPIFLAIFLTISMTAGKWQTQSRYFAPAIPLICAFAASYFHLSGISQIPYKRLLSKSTILIYFGASIIFIIVFFFFLKYVKDNDLFGWTPYLMIMNIYMPIIIFFLLLLFLFTTSGGLSRARGALAVLILGLWPMVAYVPIYLQHSTKVVERRFYPIAAFRQHLNVGRDTRLLVSRATAEHLGTDVNRALVLFFPTPVPSENVLVQSDWPFDAAIDYAIGTRTEVERWARLAGRDAEYAVFEPRGEFGLLCAAKACGRGPNGPGLGQRGDN